MATAADCYLKYGFPDAKMEMQHCILWDVPDAINVQIKTVPNRIYCNKDLIEPLTAAFELIITRNAAKELKTWDGCFNIRPKRGYEKIYKTLVESGKQEEAIKFLSNHCWGIAIDINAAWNGLGKPSTQDETLVRCFTDVGFNWGGAWRGRTDPMHFELTEVL